MEEEKNQKKTVKKPSRAIKKIKQKEICSEGSLNESLISDSELNLNLK